MSTEQAPVMTFDATHYPNLSKYATLMPPPSRPVLGREDEMQRLVASLSRPELSNPFLLGEAGAGKTALVQGASVMDTKRLYVEVDLAKMAASESGEDGVVQMATRIKSLFEEATRYRSELLAAQADIDEYDETPRYEELVTFVDEFHLLVQLSTAASQAIKPILAESGRRGVRIIAATTFAEFHEFIEKDQALMQRLQRINVREPEKDVVLSILASIAESHGVLDVIYDETLFEKIYEYSNRYVPADSQPRKSILMLDAMIGWHRAFPDETAMDAMLLAKVIHESSGVHVAFELDAGAIEHSLNQRVFSQPFAARVIENRLQIAVADLHDKTRPISSMLFTGTTGTGKTEMVKAMTELVFGDERRMIRFDMSEFSLETSVDRFREDLTHAVWNNSHAIVLFDEVEKANENITRVLLQVLDDGRLSNAQGREVSFLNTYIILTTNAGSNVLNEIQPYVSGEKGFEGYEKIIRHSLLSDDAFAPEILNRMNVVVPFSPLGQVAYQKIAKRKLGQLEQEVRRNHGVNLRFLPDVVTYVTEERMDTDTNSGGARGIVAVIESEIVSTVARIINQNPTWKDLVISVGGTMAVSDKTMRKGTAHILVQPEEKKASVRQTRKSEELARRVPQRPVAPDPGRFNRKSLEVRR